MESKSQKYAQPIGLSPLNNDKPLGIPLRQTFCPSCLSKIECNCPGYCGTCGRVLYRFIK